MTAALTNERTLRAQAANDLSTSFAELMPRGGADVSDFLFQASYALGEREADLARLVGVSQATLSSWKRRGGIPPAQAEWFLIDFVPAVFRGNAPKQHEGFRHAGIEIALAVYKQTDFDPFRNLFSRDTKRVEVCYASIGPISRLGLFVLRRLEHDRGEQGFDQFLWDRVTPKVAELARLGTTVVSQ